MVYRVRLENQECQNLDSGFPKSVFLMKRRVKLYLSCGTLAPCRNSGTRKRNKQKSTTFNTRTTPKKVY